MAEAAPATRLQAKFSTDSNQQPIQKDAEQAVTDNGNVQDNGNDSEDGMIDPIEVRNGLQNQLESIELDLVTSYSHVIGDDTVTEAVEDLQTAVSRSDREAFATSHNSLMAAVEATEESESSRILEDLLHDVIREDLERFKIQGKDASKTKELAQSYNNYLARKRRWIITVVAFMPSSARDYHAC
jgi:hypothetical protein